MIGCKWCHILLLIIPLWGLLTLTAVACAKDSLEVQYNLEEDEKHESLENNLIKESIATGRKGFLSFPMKNTREIRLINLADFDQDVRERKIEEYKYLIATKETLYEDNEVVQDLEYKLLDKGVFAICGWAFKMPPPLDEDHQCTQTELKFLLENIGPIQQDSTAPA